jgi:hypothetical protein
MKKVTLLVMAVLLMVSTGLAQRGRNSQKITLTPTPLGQAVNLKAQATKGKRGDSEFFVVQVRAHMGDGTVIQVLIDTTSGQTDIPAGLITLEELEFSGDEEVFPPPDPENRRPINRFSFGELRLTRGSLGGTLPLSMAEIKAVRLAYSNEVLAEGAF